jgi:hypothetical protein
MSEELKNEVVAVESVEVSHKGMTFTVNKKPEDWSLAALEAYEDGKNIGVLRGLLGPLQWRRYMATNPSQKDFGELTNAVFSVVGVSEGESND